MTLVTPRYVDTMSNFPGTYATTKPDHPAYVMASTGRSVSYRELDEAANRVSHLIRSCGVEHGGHVAFCLENHEDYFKVAWGCVYAGVYWTAMSSRLTVDEMEYIIDDCGAKVFITSAYKKDAAVELLDRNPGLTHRFVLDIDLDGHERLEDAVAAQPPEPLPDPRYEGQDMLYSSGTTGRPKGIRPALPERQIGDPGDPYVAVFGGMYGFDTDTAYLSPAPLYHAAPLRFSATIQAIGGTVVILDRFDPEAALAAIEEYRVTHSQWVPTHFVRMLKLPEEVRARYDVSSLKVAIHAAAPCPPEVKRAMIDWWGPVLFEYYAATEGAGITFINSQEWLAHPGSVGRGGILGDVRICDDETGAVLGPRQVGTIYFERDTVSFEYHNDPDKTKAARHPQHETWATTGDLGYVDEEGWLYLTDRKAFMIISGGVNIYPREAEDALALHPAVHDVAVIGVPDPEMGESVLAVVTPAPGVEAGPALERELIAFVRERIAAFKAPRRVVFTDDMPRTPTGKLVKQTLRDRYREVRA
jgi:long-chain acyl-CoA synthetase